MNLFRRKPKIKSAELAQMLFDEFVSNPQEIPPNLTIGDESASTYERKMLLYRSALALMVLMREEQKKAKYLEVRQTLEALIFPPSPTNNGMVLLAEIRDAMRQISDLISSAGKDGSTTWARNWLRGITIEEYNPASLYYFEIWWMDSFLMLTKMLRELNPVTGR